MDKLNKIIIMFCTMFIINTLGNNAQILNAQDIDKISQSTVNAVPQIMHYSGYLTDASDEPVTGNYNAELSIWNQKTGGSKLWSESQTIDVHKGLFNVTIGKQDSIPSALFENDMLWLQVTISGENLLPRKQICSVGYSFNSKDVKGADIQPNSITIPSYGLVIDNTGKWVGDPTDLQGPQGQKGDKGDTGATGPQGPKGDKGDKPNHQWSATSLRFENPTGNWGSYVNLKGEKGDKGDKGDTGPQGLKGEAGATGPQGPKGDKGDPGEIEPGMTVSGNRSDHILKIINSGSGDGLKIETEMVGIDVLVSSTSYGGGWAIKGYNELSGGIGVFAKSDAGLALKVDGTSDFTDQATLEASVSNSGVIKSNNTSTTYGNTSGIWGNSDAFNTRGVLGTSLHGCGVYGLSSLDGIGVLAQSASGTALRVAGTSTFTGYATFSGGHGDLAELFYKSEELEGGDVVVIDQTKNLALKKCNKPYDLFVAGIVSTSPSQILAGKIKEEDSVPLALVGHVECKVTASNGPIEIGDLLTTSTTPGHAMKATELKIGSIVGKALEPLKSGTGKIEVLVMLR